MTLFLKRFFIISVVLVLFAGIFIWKWVFKEQDLSVGAQKADVTLSSDMLVKEFETNENSANAKYVNKIVDIKGTIEAIAENDKELTVTLKKAGDTGGVVCSFNKPVMDKSLFKVGSLISIKGICSGYLMDVVLNRCSIEK